MAARASASASSFNVAGPLRAALSGDAILRAAAFKACLPALAHGLAMLFKPHIDQ